MSVIGIQGSHGARTVLGHLGELGFEGEGRERYVCAEGEERRQSWELAGVGVS